MTIFFQNTFLQKNVSYGGLRLHGNQKVLYAIELELTFICKFSEYFSVIKLSEFLNEKM